MGAPLNVAFFGSSLVSAYWNGAATYYRGIIRGLFERGHHVRFHEPDAYQRQQHRDIDDPYYADVSVYHADPAAALREVRGVRNADIVVKASGVGVNDALLEEAVLEHQARGAKVIFWDVDAPATLESLKRDKRSRLAALIGAYDAIFTYGGGERVVNEYLSLGARRCVPVYNAVDPDVHCPVPPDPRFGGDLAFLGNRMPDRERRVEHFFFGPARRMPHRRFLIGGSGWGEHVPELENVVYLGHVYTQEHNAFNCSPLAVLSINRESMATFGYSPATRIFEAAGAGACIISDAWEGIDHFLEPGRECLVAQSGPDVEQILESLDKEAVRRIGRAGRLRVLSEHTYAHRAQQVERALYE